jgi:hypothetical protein
MTNETGTTQSKAFLRIAETLVTVFSKKSERMQVMIVHYKYHLLSGNLSLREVSHLRHEYHRLVTRLSHLRT